MSHERRESDVHDVKHDSEFIEEAAIARLTEEDVIAMSKEAIQFRSWATIRICMIIFVQGCNQAGYGIDWAVIGGTNSLPAFHSFFGVPNAGGTYGTIVALMTIGNVAGAPFLALGDVIGRRGINWIGNFIVICASLMQGLAQNLPTLMAGRFFMGFGSALMSNSQYMAEVSPTHWRGRIVGIFGACFQVGSIAMNAAMMGTSTIESNWSWRLPFLLQMIFPVIVCALTYVCTPESPRYLMMRDREDEARRVIAKYHTTSGQIDNPIVDVVITQIKESMLNEPRGWKAAWDFRVFFTRRVGYRTFILTLYSIFQQWNGGSIISYYLSPVLDMFGITDATKQLGVNLGLTATYFVFTTVGAFLVDIMNRRTMIFAGLISFILLQTASTITTWRYSINPTTAAGALSLLWIFLFQIFSSLLIATMHNLYPVELLSLPLRARGMGLYGLIQGGAGAVQSYGIGVGIAKVGYKIWCVYIVYNLVQLVIAYFTFPETRGLTLEEIDAIFETPGVHPVKMSKDIMKAKKERQRIAAEGEITVQA